MIQTQIIPSLLSMNFASIENEMKRIPNTVNILHLDIMDGNFVNNISFGPVVVKHIRKYTDKLLDTHLMISAPDRYIEEFYKAGSDMISFHIETVQDTSETIRHIKELNMKAGIALNPETPVEDVLPYLKEADYFLVMSVHPGFAGQKFIPEVLRKVEILVKEREGDDFAIEIDGGINRETSLLAKKSGADWIVSGSYLFSSVDSNKRIEEMLNDR